MDLTLIRAKRTKEQNQERAYIAAARRTDRPFNQRLDSLRKASELHLARTGRRFKVDEGQLSSRGPLEEIEKRQQSPFYQGRFSPYPQPWDLFRQESPKLMFKTETTTSLTGIENLTTGPHPFQDRISPHQLESWAYGESQLLEGIGQAIEHELLPPVKEKDGQNINPSQEDGIHADKSLLQESPTEVLVMHSHSAFPPSFFERDQFEAFRHQSPKMNEQDVQNFIDQYLLQPSPALLALSTSRKLLLKEPLANELGTKSGLLFLS